MNTDDHPLLVAAIKANAEEIRLLSAPPESSGTSGRAILGPKDFNKNWDKGWNKTGK